MKTLRLLYRGSAHWRIALTAILFTGVPFSPGALDFAEYERQHVWSSDRSAITYGLTDLDPEFPRTGYEYCKWGNWMDENQQDDVLHFSPLTALPYSNSNT